METTLIISEDENGCNSSEVITGVWKNDRLHFGHLVNNSTGESYSGGFKNKLFHGFGELTFANGDRFVGKWVEGRFIGTVKGEVNELLLLKCKQWM